MPGGATHEDFGRLPHHAEASSRGFGFVFGAVFALYALWPLTRGEETRWGAAAVGALLFLLALARPSLLDVPSSLWHRFGALLARITNPLVMSALFVLVFIPTSVLFRLFRKDPLQRTRAQVDSYWLNRNPPGPPPESMANQF